MAGIAPGGVVVVWIIGTKNYREAFFGQAEKVNNDPGHAFALPFENKADSDEYINEGLHEALTDEELVSLQVDGIPFGLWSRYGNKCMWKPVVKGGHSQVRVNIGYLNGESDKNWTPFESPEITEDRPVPRWMTFTAVVQGDETLYQIDFDEFELMEACEKLGAEGQKLYIEFTPTWHRTDVTVRVFNDEHSIQLTRFVSDDW